MSQQKSRFMQWMDHLHDLLVQGKEIPPVPAQIVVPLQSTETQIVYPAIDTDGAYVPRETLGTPVAQYRWMGKDMETWQGVTLSAQAANNINASNTQNIQDTFSVSKDTDRLSAVWFTEAVDTGVPKDSNGNYVKLKNCFVYRGPGQDLQPFTLADFGAAVTYWGTKNKDGSSRWPIISHPEGGVSG